MPDKLPKSKSFQDALNEMSIAFKKDIEALGLSLLLLGEFGSGKTFGMRTARKPVIIDMFDPRGGLGLRDIEGDGIYIDPRWAGDDPMKPTKFEEWSKEMDKRVKSGFFEGVGTYVLDSATTWSDAIMNQIMYKRGQAGKEPDTYDTHWKPQKEAVKKYIKTLQSLPCDIVVTGHLKEVYRGKGKDRRLEKYVFKTTGDLAQYIPSLFSEIWIALPKKKATGLEYQVLTQSEKPHIARSRLAANGLLDRYEPLDIKYILEKVGMPTEDKPY
jgi:hypothetical protein